MFQQLLSFYPLVIPFLLVLFRVTGLFAFVPVFSNLAIPGNVKALLILAITVCIYPSVPTTLPASAGLIGVTIAILGELSVGLLIGMMTTLVFAGAQLGAHLLSQQMGLSLGAVYDPMFDDQSTVLEQIAFWTALTAFFALGGHRELINALVNSYQSVPMGRGIDPQRLLEITLGSLTASFHLAIRVGAPALAAFFLSSLSSAFISKSMPQMNIMSVGLSLNLLLGITMILLGLAGWSILSSQAWRELFMAFHRVFGG